MSRAYWADLAERAATTYVCTFIGLVLTGGGHWHSMSHLQSAAVAALPATLATVKGLLARRVGDPNSAALLPAQKGESSGGQ